jgi:hypothetical protein
MITKAQVNAKASAGAMKRNTSTGGSIITITAMIQRTAMNEPTISQPATSVAVNTPVT